MKQIEEMKKDLTDTFDEEYAKRYLITPQYTADKLYAKGYRKQSEVASEIFMDIDRVVEKYSMGDIEYPAFLDIIAELKKKYTEVQK